MALFLSPGIKKDTTSGTHQCLQAGGWLLAFRSAVCVCNHKGAVLHCEVNWIDCRCEISPSVNATSFQLSQALVQLACIIIGGGGRMQKDSVRPLSSQQ